MTFRRYFATRPTPSCPSAGTGFAVCLMSAPFRAAIAVFGAGISTLCRWPGECSAVLFGVGFQLRIEDLQRGIKVAFEVPESHLAGAIAYLMGVAGVRDDFPTAIVEKLQTLVTPKGWSLCVDLLKIRLTMRAQKLGDAHRHKRLLRFRG